MTELTTAFEHYQATVRRAVAEQDWTLFAGLFTEDANYHEHAYGRFSGRPAITDWAVHTMTTFPGNAMVGFPISWSVLDEERGWIVCEVANRMEDPGDGSIHDGVNITILKYAGDGLWASEEDVYNPAHFGTMLKNWEAAKRAAG